MFDGNLNTPLGDHAFSTFPNFFEKHFVPRDMHLCLRVSGGKKIELFGKFCKRTE